MSSLFAMLFVLAGPPDVDERPSYLFQMKSGPDHAVQLTGERYHPQPGDLVLFDSHSELNAKLYAWCGTGRPLHAAIVFHREDGTPAILEAGTNGVMKVFVFDFDTRMHEFDGTILVRRVRTPLSKDQAEQLREFAQAQEGKPYALGRALMHAVPFRPRDPGITKYFGRTVLDRERWICSELAVAAATAAGVLNETDHPANVMLPRDLCYDERYDLSPYYELPALWYPHPEVEEVGAGVRVGNRK
jgi:hypothetical protein